MASIGTKDRFDMLVPSRDIPGWLNFIQTLFKHNYTTADNIWVEEIPNYVLLMAQLKDGD